MTTVPDISPEFNIYLFVRPLKSWVGLFTPPLEDFAFLCHWGVLLSTVADGTLERSLEHAGDPNLGTMIELIPIGDLSKAHKTTQFDKAMWKELWHSYPVRFVGVTHRNIDQIWDQAIRVISEYPHYDLYTANCQNFADLLITDICVDPAPLETYSELVDRIRNHHAQAGSVPNKPLATPLGASDESTGMGIQPTEAPVSMSPMRTGQFKVQYSQLAPSIPEMTVLWSNGVACLSHGAEENQSTSVVVKPQPRVQPGSEHAPRLILGVPLASNSTQKHDTRRFSMTFLQKEEYHLRLQFGLGRVTVYDTGLKLSRDCSLRRLITLAVRLSVERSTSDTQTLVIPDAFSCKNESATEGEEIDGLWAAGEINVPTSDGETLTYRGLFMKMYDKYSAVSAILPTHSSRKGEMSLLGLELSDLIDKDSITMRKVPNIFGMEEQGDNVIVVCSGLQETELSWLGATK